MFDCMIFSANEFLIAKFMRAALFQGKVSRFSIAQQVTHVCTIFSSKKMQLLMSNGLLHMIIFHQLYCLADLHTVDETASASSIRIFRFFRCCFSEEFDEFGYIFLFFIFWS